MMVIEPYESFVVTIPQLLNFIQQNNNDSEESSDYDENIYKYDINPIQVKEHFSFLFDKFKKRGTRKNNHHLVKMFHNENLK